MEATRQLERNRWGHAAPGIAVASLVFIKVMLHLATAARYGIFRDELYYIACARHLAFGYVDHPPLIALITWLTMHLFGSSLGALRLLPALAGGMLVWVTARMARELGGGGFAQVLAGLAILPVPIYLILNHWLTMNAFEPLLWALTLWAALRMVARNDARLWLAIGALIGVGLENKYSMAFLAGALVLGLLLTPERRLLKTWWFAAGVGIAVVLFLPNLLWLARHGFPFLEFERHSRMSGSRIVRGPVAFLADQVVMMNPVLAPLWIAGLVWFFRSAVAKRYRFAGWTALLVIALLLGMQAKNYYVSPVYPILFASGAIALERACHERFRWAGPVYVGVVVVSGLVLAPLVMPVLPVDRLLAYQKAWHGFTPVVFEVEPGGLPQYFSDEFGWENMARQTAVAFHALSPEEQKTTALFANDYGQAAAIDFFGPRYGLPASVSGAETFWLWGPRQYTGSTVIVLGSNGRGDREHFRTVEPAGLVDDPRSRHDEQFQIFLCRGLSPDLQTLWPKLKKW
jgi:hypothetical protein